MSIENTNYRADAILNRVLEFSESKELFDCGIIVVGLSGGPDSVGLLNILKGLKDRSDIGCEVRAFHCNHHLRPVVCDEEAEQVKRLCGDLGIELKVVDFDCEGFAKQNRISEETAGRVLRYEAFEQYAQLLECQSGKEVRIAIAHHKDDIAETMMMNLFRGSGLEGLVNPKSRSGRIIRPLLCLNKTELIEYLDALGVGYAVDQTNLTADGTRNNWRNVFLPDIGEFYHEDPAVPLTRTYKLLADDLDFITESVEKARLKCRKVLSGYPVISVSDARDLHPAIRSRVIRSLWCETFGNLIDFEEIHLNDCVSLMVREVTGEQSIDMPFGRKAYRNGDFFGFTESDGIEDLSGAIAGRMGFLVSGGMTKLEVGIDDIPCECAFCDNIPNSALKLKAVRIENEGDLEYNDLSWFCPAEILERGKITVGNCSSLGNGYRVKRAGSDGSKDLKRLMTDLKVPESCRKNIVFFVADGEVVWLPGYGHSIGFTNAASREKFTASVHSDGGKPEALIKFTVERVQ